MHEKGASILNEILQVWAASHCRCPAADGPLFGVAQDDVVVEVFSEETRAEGFAFSAHGPPQGTELLDTDFFGRECLLEVGPAGRPVDLVC